MHILQRNTLTESGDFDIFEFCKSYDSIGITEEEYKGQGNKLPEGQVRYADYHSFVISNMFKQCLGYDFVKAVNHPEFRQMGWKTMASETLFILRDLPKAVWIDFISFAVGDYRQTGHMFGNMFRFEGLYDEFKRKLLKSVREDNG
jgi:hypothetical protein